MTDEEIRLEKEQQREEKREKRKKELAKISSLHGKERLQYLWDYYKVVLLVLIFIIIGISVVVSMVRGAMTDTIFQAGAISADYNSSADQIRPDFEAYIGGLKKHQDTSYDLSIVLQPGDMGQAAQVAEVKLQVALSAQTLDALLIPDDLFGYVQQKGVLLSLDDLLSGDEKTRYQEAGDLAWAKPADPSKAGQTSSEDRASGETDAEDDARTVLPDDAESEGTADASSGSGISSSQGDGDMIYGVRVDDSGVLAKYAWYPANEKVYFAVADNAKHKEMAHTFLNFLKGVENHE